MPNAEPSDSDTADDDDLRYMRRALELAAQGEGSVEPNPMVGCVVVQRSGGEAVVVGEGWHERFGGEHAEVNALRQAGDAARGATAYVTLEPCRHQGKTPPCTGAVIAAGVRRVVVATPDPFAEVNGGGIAELRAAGVECQVGVAADEAQTLLAPYLKLIKTGRPWVIAKWAMTLDGKIAARDGSSQWISSPESRAIVHRLRGRVDAVVVGRGTAEADDPLLTARPPGPRVATRVVMGVPPRGSKLVATIDDAPLIAFARDEASSDAAGWLVDRGAEVLVAKGSTDANRFAIALDELGRRRMTNVLVEGGAAVLGAAFDAGAVDEAHVFVAPKIVGGSAAPTPIAGDGLAPMADCLGVADWEATESGGDVYLRGRVER
ncbi:MAG: bifunctional diaminohydroxyphosphoribosylaminopyrimidine deaminase/5-amino-6-(5-phosphoribosylamino)uracil reductase RibD [Planctomycetota bacterium]